MPKFFECFRCSEEDSIFEVDADLSEDYEKELDLELEVDFLNLSVPAEKNPCPSSFAEFRNGMLKVSDGVYKNVLKPGKSEIDLERSEVLYKFATFIEGTEDPCESSTLTNLGKVNVPEGIEPTPGLYLALASMKKGEEALFWISSNLMYGKFGCPPRIPPNADILFKAKIVEVVETGNEKIKRKKTFDELRKEAVKAMKSAEVHYKSHEYQQSINIYRKYITKLQDAHLQDEEEEKKQKELLIKMYQNVSVCYNKVNKPEKTCVMIRELEHLTSIKNNVKALYAKGFANMILNNFREARKCLKAVERIAPENINVGKTLRKLECRENEQIQYQIQQEKIIKQREEELQEFEMLQQMKAESRRQDQGKLEQTKEALDEKIQDFVRNHSIKHMILPMNVNTHEETEMIEKLCQKYQITLKGLEPGDEGKTIFYLVKDV